MRNISRINPEVAHPASSNEPVNPPKSGPIDREEAELRGFKKGMQKANAALLQQGIDPKTRKKIKNPISVIELLCSIPVRLVSDLLTRLLLTIKK